MHCINYDDRICEQSGIITQNDLFAIEFEAIPLTHMKSLVDRLSDKFTFHKKALKIFDEFHMS